MTLSTLKSVTEFNEKIKTEKDALDFLLSDGVIKNDRECIKCGKSMVLRKRKETYEFRCRLSKNKDCSTQGIRCGSWFDRTRIPLKDCVLIVVLWIQKYSSKQIRNEIKLNPGTVVDFRNYLRNACTEIVTSYPMIGGSDKTVQIDECAIHTRKYGRGEADREITWILGAIEMNSRKCFVKIIPNRSKATMLPILRQWIHPNSVVWTDSHKSYGTLNKYFKKHESVNHSIEFTKIAADGTVVHTNSIESLWKRLKAPLKESNGTSEGLLPSYLDELMVREHEGDQFGERVWQFIKDFK